MLLLSSLSNFCNAQVFLGEYFDLCLRMKADKVFAIVRIDDI